MRLILSLLPNLSNDPLLGHLLFISYSQSRKISQSDIDSSEILEIQTPDMVSSFEDASNSATFYVKLL